LTRIEFPATCLVDTTALIHLASPKQQYHSNALEYFQAMQAQQTKFYLSTLVIAEYGFKGGRDGVASVLASLSARVCGFDMEAAFRYGTLAKQHPGIFQMTTPEKERVVIDLMLVATADYMGLESIISSDTNLCGPFLKGTSRAILGLDIKKPITGMYPLWSSEES